MATGTTVCLFICLTLALPSTHAGGPPDHPLATAVVAPAWVKVGEVTSTHVDDVATDIEDVPLGVSPESRHSNATSGVTDCHGNSCGTAENFINNGNNVRGDSPHTYSVTIQAEHEGAWYHLCGGALIAENKVLTAAHCMDPSNHNFRVGVGWTRLSHEGEEHVQTIAVDHVTMHPNYTVSQSGNSNPTSDLAVLTLASSVTLAGVAILTPNPQWRQGFTYWRCYLTGWGRPYVGASEMSNRLRSGVVGVMWNYQCQRYFNTFSGDFIHDSNLCTLDYPNLVNGCEGDGGAPLVCDGHLAGILSWGLRQCNGCTPDVFTRVSSHLDWVTEQVAVDGPEP